MKKKENIRKCEMGLKHVNEAIKKTNGYLLFCNEYKGMEKRKEWNKLGPSDKMIWSRKAKRYNLNKGYVHNYSKMRGMKGYRFFKNVKKSESESENECAICQDIEDTSDMVKIDCGHIYHYNCIIRWDKGDCPMCRRHIYISEEKITKIYNDIKSKKIPEEDEKYNLIDRIRIMQFLDREIKENKRYVVLMYFARGIVEDLDWMLAVRKTENMLDKESKEALIFLSQCFIK